MTSSLEQIGDTMLAIGKDLFPRGYLNDAYVWDEDNDVTIAWVMEPDKLRRAVPYMDPMPFQGAYAAGVLKRHGGRGETLRYERDMVAADFLERLQNDLGDLFGWGEPYDRYIVTFIPEPGYPWPHTYYSARQRKMIDGSRRPKWLLPANIVDEDKGINSPGVDFCTLIGPLKRYEMGGEVAVHGKHYFIVTHAMGTMSQMTRFGDWSENARQVNSCGGLLFPSLAVGQIPGTNFGPFVLVADVGIVVRSLKPHLKKGHLPAYVYDTDVWSMTTGDFFKDAAVAAFQQLTGRSDYVYYLDMNIWPLGAPQAPELHGPGVAERILQLSKLKKEVTARTRVYHRGLTPEEMEDIIGDDAAQFSKLRYPYLEAKANGVMPMSSFPLAVAPEQAADGFEKFLDATGFKGELLTVELPGELAEVMDPAWDPKDITWERRQAIQAWANVEYGWHVADAVREHGREVVL